MLQVVIMLYAVIYAINGCIFLEITYLDIVIGNFRKTVYLGIVKIASNKYCRTINSLTTN